MVGGKEIADLRLRKQMLILESHLNRAELEADWEELHRATAWLRRAATTLNQARPLLLLLAPLAGLMVGRRPARPAGFVRRLLGLLKWIRPLLGLWRSFAGEAPEPGRASHPAKP
jgi:hypothetical protein